MLDFRICRDPKTQEEFIETSLSGKPLMTTPQLNKGTAFNMEERHAFGLIGKLPHRVETLEEQVLRAYLQFTSYSTRLQQNIYLNNLHDKNQVLFYKLVSKHLSEMIPVIYTPIVGAAVKRYSHEFRQPRGLYIAHTDADYLDEIILNRSNPNIDLIVVTDGEGVLGIGDQGIGGMDIPVAKLMVYSLCGGIDPTRTLPIFLDVGTNNSDLLNDPLYLGCRHPRIEGDAYYEFTDKFVAALRRHFPNAFLHWEDFGRNNARKVLERYQDNMCSFNDDIQGTGAVTLAAVLAACNIADKPLSAQRIVVFGAGSAGTGIADQMVDALVRNGMTKEEAHRLFWLIDRQGLLLDNDKSLTPAQQPYARQVSEFAADKTWDLAHVVKAVKPTMLIGCSAQAGAFTSSILENMAHFNDRPIIFPLSNPDEKCEATPEDILKHTKGRALIATGTAFPDVRFEGETLRIAQCNNALVFPGIGVGVLAVRAHKLSASMIWAAAHALSMLSPISADGYAPLLPSLDEAQTIAQNIAFAVAKEAIKEGLAGEVCDDVVLEERIKQHFWQPKYLPFRRS